MTFDIKGLLESDIPFLLRTHGFRVDAKHPECQRLIDDVILHLRALLIDAEDHIWNRLRASKREKSERRYFTDAIYQISYHYVRIYKDKLSLTGVGLGHTVPCDLSVLHSDYLAISVQSTIDYLFRRDRRRPHGGRRRSSNVSLPLTRDVPAALQKLRSRKAPSSG